MIEVMITVAVLGIVAAIAIPSISSLNKGVQKSSLQSDVATINRSVAAYLASGGKLDGITDPQVVLDRIKSTQKAENAKMATTFSGSMLDKRLAVQYIPTNKVGPDNDITRAVWDKDEKKFVLTTSGQGIEQFILDENLAEKDYGTETRDMGTFHYNKNSGWVWDGVEKMPDERTGVDVVSTSTPTETTPPVVVNSLNPPQIYPASGAFSTDDLPFQVRLNNPNPPGTWMLYSVNNGPWKRYTAPFNITEDSTVSAFSEGNSAQWTSSSQVSGTWTFTPPTPPQELAPPLITLSSDEFNDDNETIDYSITNPNPAGSSQIYFIVTEVNAPVPPRTSWSLYQQGASLSYANYPDGFRISAYAKTVNTTIWLDSETSEKVTSANFFGIPTSGDILYVLDGSGSMSANFAGQSRWSAVVQETISSINSLNPSDRFGLVVFSSGIKYNSGNTLEPATQANKNTVINAIQGMGPGGGTNYQVALASGLNFNPQPAQMFFLSDGFPNSQNYGGTINQLNSAGITVNTIGLATSGATSSILSAIANQLGGTYVNIQP